MKHIYYISVLIVALLQTFNAHASIDPNQRVFYVYRNDGNINTFFYSDVDSVVYSKIDIDSLVCDTYVTQEVWTPDTVVRIPLNVISRVGFQTPETIYTKEAAVMSDELLDYIVRSDSLDLYLSQAVPASLLPQIGDKLITTKRTAALPGGFLGQVSEIDNSGDSIIVKCQQIPLTDVFERYYGVFDILGYTTEEGEQPKETLDPVHYFDATFPFGPIIVPFTFGVTKNDIAKYTDGTVGCECSLEIKSPNMRICGCLIIDKELYIPPLAPLISPYKINMSIGGDYEAILNFDIYGSFSSTPWDIPLKPSVFIPTTVPGLFIYQTFGLSIRVEGKVSTGCSIKNSGRYGVTINWPIINNSNLPAKLQIKPEETSIDPIILAGEMSLFLGGYNRLGINLCGLIDGYTRLEAGLRINAEAELHWEDIFNMGKNTGFYDLSRQNMNYNIKPYFDRSFNLAFAGETYSNSFGIEYWPTFLTSYFVPTFNNLKASRDGNKYTFSADVEDNVWPGTPVGFRLVDEDENTIYTDYCPTAYEKSIFRHSFNNYHLTTTLDLKPNKKYYLYPILKLFSTFEMLCSPREFVRFSVWAQTGNARVVNVDATISGSLFGSLDMLDNTTKVGFFYGEDATPESTGVCVETAWNESGGMLCNLRNLKEETVYYYRAFALINGEYVYGDVESFKTQKRDGETVDLGLSVQWRGWNIGAETPGEYGTYYAWAETSPKSNYSWDTYTDNVYDDSGNWTGCSINTDISDTYRDVAGSALGNNWRMPTKSEMQELIDKCTWTWTEINGVNGYEVTGPNGHHIFLPAAGNFDGQSVNNIGSYGGYWTSTPNTENSNSMAGSLFFYGSDTYKVHNIQWSNRYSGRTIRPVKPYPN